MKYLHVNNEGPGGPGSSSARVFGSRQITAAAAAPTRKEGVPQMATALLLLGTCTNANNGHQNRLVAFPWMDIVVLCMGFFVFRYTLFFI